MKKAILLSLISVFMMFLSCEEEKILTNVDCSIDNISVTATEVDIRGSYIANADVLKITMIYSEDYDMDDYSSKTVSLSSDSFEVKVTDLEPNTKYYFYFRFSDNNNKVNTDIESFTTKNNDNNDDNDDNNVVKPSVTTKSVSNISQDYASCGGNVTNNGGAQVTARGVCWSTSQNPTTSNSHTSDGAGNGEFTSSLTGLSANTKYYVRAYATNSAGTSYGEEKSFTTTQNNDKPTVTTKNVTNVTETTASCGGNVTNNGGAQVTARGVCWSTSQNPTISNSHTSNGTGNGEFTSSITGLTPNTTYYIRAYATNSVGTSYGEQKTFKTSSSAWIQYDNGSIDGAIGLASGPGSLYWANVYPSSMLQAYSGMKLTRVALGVSDEKHSGTLMIFIGDTQVHSQSYNANSTNSIVEIALTTPVTINSSKDLCIMFNNNNGQYVAAYSYEESNSNGRWISTDGEEWIDAIDAVDDVGSWIIRGYVTNSSKEEVMLTPQEFKKNPNAKGGTLSKSK